jgi:hypothetical protein
VNKSLAWRVLFSFLGVLIVLPVIRSVNIAADTVRLTAPVLMTDGDPMPPPKPPRASFLVADGDPMPPPKPPNTIAAA